MKTKIISMTMFIAMLLLSACGASMQVTQEPAATLPPVRDSSGITAEGHVEPIRYTDLALNANGLVSEVLSAEGDQVTAGQVIARLESDQAQSMEAAQAKALQELTSAYESVRDAQFRVDNFDVPSDFTGMTPSEVVEGMLVKLDKARADFEPYKNIDDRNLEQTEAEKKGAVTTGTAKIYKRVLDDAWADYRKAIQWLELVSSLKAAQTQLDQAQKDYDSLLDSSFAEDTASARAALANAEVRAPYAGIITKLDLKVGEFASAGTPVVTITDKSSWVIKTTDLTEIDVVNVKEGEPVEVTLDAIPGVTLKGHVLSISQSFSEKQGDIVYEVTILLTDQHPTMRWGMTAEVTFER